MFAQLDINQLLNQHGFSVVAAGGLAYAGWRFLNRVWDDLTSKLDNLSGEISKTADNNAASNQDLKEITIKLIDKMTASEKATSQRLNEFSETIVQIDKHVYSLSRILNHKEGKPVDQSMVGQPGVKPMEDI